MSQLTHLFKPHNLNEIITRQRGFSPCIIHNRVESVRNSKDGAVFKLSLNSRLDEIIRLQVDSSSRFIKYEDSRLPEKGSGQTHQLPLPHAGENATGGISQSRLQR